MSDKTMQILHAKDMGKETSRSRVMGILAQALKEAGYQVMDAEDIKAGAENAL